MASSLFYCCGRASRSRHLRWITSNPRVQTYTCSLFTNTHRIATSHVWTRSCHLQQNGESSRGMKTPSLVIFDKNGTLTCFHSKWSPWIQATASRLEVSSGLSLLQNVYSTLGFCPLTQKTRTGLLGHATSSQVKKGLEEVLVSSGIEHSEANWIVEQNWEEWDTANLGHVRQLTDLPALFAILKDHDIKIGISTSDSRKVAKDAFQDLGIFKDIDAMVCGDDKDCRPKPSSHNANMICKQLGVHPKEAVMVGDTRTDIGMSISAGLGMSIGVLSGIGSRLDLHQADHIVDTVQDILPLILPIEREGDVYRYSGFGKEFVIPMSNITSLPKSHDAKPVASDEQKASLVIFDKDGTLTCVHAVWVPWAVQLIERANAVTGLDLTKKICDVLAFNKTLLKCSPGHLATSSQSVVFKQLENIIRDVGLTQQETSAAMDKIWDECETGNAEKIEPLGNLQGLFTDLTKHGVKIAVCTSDSRFGTEGALRVLGLSGFVDYVVCGDDPGSKPKPHPDKALKICRELDVHPSKTVMVGDSEVDMEMGRLAKLGANIAVLSGVGSTKHLAALTDHVVPSVDFLLPIVLGQVKKHHPPNTKGLLSTHKGQRSYHTSSKTTDNPFHVLKRNFCTTNHRQINISSGDPQYSYVIVGAGSAGCVLSNRISADSDNTVMLLEAGPKDESWKIHMPAALMYNLCDDRYNWYYHTVPQKHMNNRVMYCPRGRVWGGSSALNAMVYIRGHAYDYDRWESMGATGWSYADCLPYFQKSQTHELGADDYRGGEGPLHVSRSNSNNPLHKAFITAGQQAGFPFTNDMNGYQQEGVGWMDMTIQRGVRWSAAKAYLRPILYRSNIDTENSVMASGVIFDGSKAVGVEYQQYGQTKRVYAEKEVILCGGSINSPQLLMLSGIGNADDLKKLDIPIVSHRPGVGQNLQDHLEMCLQQKCSKPICLYSAELPHNMVGIGLEWFMQRTGWCATTHFETGGFIRSNTAVEHPDIQFQFVPTVVHDHGRQSGGCHGYQVHVYPARSSSRGSIKLKSVNPEEHPIIDFNYLSTEQDKIEMRAAIRLSREIFAQKAFDEYRQEELQPGIDVQTDEQIDAFVREKGDTGYHPSCTAKMGQESDPMAVVDPSCRVIGTEGLRVVDASIMPHIVSGNLNGPTIMLAEKAADIILGHAPRPKSTAPVFKPPSDDIRLFSKLQTEVIF